MSVGCARDQPAGLPEARDHIGGPADIRVSVEGAAEVYETISVSEGELPNGRDIRTTTRQPATRSLRRLPYG